MKSVTENVLERTQYLSWRILHGPSGLEATLRSEPTTAVALLPNDFNTASGFASSRVVAVRLKLDFT